MITATNRLIVVATLTAIWTTERERERKKERERERDRGVGQREKGKDRERGKKRENKETKGQIRDCIIKSVQLEHKE